MKTKEEYFAEIKDLLASHQIVLFAKGTKDRPACGFSGRTMEILNEYTSDYHVVNILSDPSLREYLKEYSEWPTYPQLYIGGELIGGADITESMHETGDLRSMITA